MDNTLLSQTGDLELNFSTDNGANGSHNGSTFSEELPFIETTIVVLIFSFVFLLALPTLFINLSLLIAFLKTKQLHKPLGVIHASLLVEILLNKLTITLISCSYYPSGLRYCVCSPSLSSIFFSSRVFVTSFRPIMYASLALFQLLIVTGKKRLVNFKSVCGSVVFATVVGMLFATEGAVLLNVNGEVLGCSDFCPGQSVPSFPAKNIVYISYVVIAWLPSLVIVLLSSTWSCVVFKQYYIGADNHLNRRLISMPLIMPAVLIATTALPVIMRRIVFIVLRSYDVLFIHYWLFLFGGVITLVDEILDGVIYQVLLTYLNPCLFNSWRMMFRCNEHNCNHSCNQVHPQN